MVNIKELKKLSQDLRLLYVEDEDMLREALFTYLGKIFGEVVSAKNGEEGLKAYKEANFDIVLTDIQMPIMNGLEMTKEIKKINAEQEIIIISAYSEPEYFLEAIRMGIHGYIIKPVDYKQMNQIFYSSALDIQRYKENINYKLHLEEMVHKRTKTILSLEKEKIDNYEKTLESFITMIEDRDTYTGGHSQRVANYCRLIAQEMSYPKTDCDLLFKAGIMHDIGKISTPDSILLKPGKLNDLEYHLIKGHVTVSFELLSKIPMYEDIAELIIYHHERYDGKGYPHGLKGDEIPPLARIMILADAFDAMTTNRIYKGRKHLSNAIQELKNMSGKQFHPEVVESAIKVFSTLEIPEVRSQMPKTEIEKERFAYFYRDQVTGAHNTQYLDFIISQNFYDREYDCINMLYLHNFANYNKKKGWSQGDLLLKAFANHLFTLFDDAIIFRLHGDDFILLSSQHLEIDIQAVQDFPLFHKNEITVSCKHMDLKEELLPDYNALEKLILEI